MKQLIESIINKEYTKANELFIESLNIIVAKKLNEAKKMYSAKVFSEQLNVDAQGNFRETTGNEKYASIEKAERGLAEGEVAGKIEKEDATRYNAGEYRITARPKDTTIHNTETGETHIIPGEKAQKQLADHVADGHKVTAFHAKNLIDNFNAKKIDTTSVSKLKEEAKKAAIRALQEKVRVRGNDEPPKPPLSTRAQRFSAALSGGQKPKPKLVVKND